MARKYSTLRKCFVKNKYAATTNKVKTPPDIAISGISVSTLLNDTPPTTLETLRSHINYLLRLPLPVEEKIVCV